MRKGRSGGKKIIKARGKPKTYIALILDRSGSMHQIRDAARNHFNEQVQAIQKRAVNQDVRITLVTFNEEVSTVLFNERVKDVKELTSRDYDPRGSTALYDAMGLTIEKLSAECPDLKKKDVAALVITISDGEENASQKYGGETGREKLQALITKKQALGNWTFAYMGANQDLTKVAKNLGIGIRNTMSFDPTVKGMQIGTQCNVGATMDYITLRNSNINNSHAFYSGAEPLVPIPPVEPPKKGKKGTPA